jgi:hypothetical protein
MALVLGLAFEVFLAIVLASVLAQRDSSAAGDDWWDAVR